MRIYACLVIILFPFLSELNNQQSFCHYYGMFFSSFDTISCRQCKKCLIIASSRQHTAIPSNSVHFTPNFELSIMDKL